MVAQVPALIESLTGKNLHELMQQVIYWLLSEATGNDGARRCSDAPAMDH